MSSPALTLTSFITHRAFRVDHWQDIPPETILSTTRRVYSTPHGHDRLTLRDLQKIPVVDEAGREIPIYDKHGVRVARRIAFSSPEGVSYCALYQDLTRTQELFRGTNRPVHDDPAFELHDPDEHPVNVDDADYELNHAHFFPSAASLDNDIPFDRYPHFYSGTYGQWQARGIMKPMLSHLRKLERTLRIPGGGRPCLVAIKSQCYNTISHNMRDDAKTHIAQNGILTGTVAGAWASTPRAKDTSRRLFRRARHQLPHQRLAEQITSANYTYQRHEVVLMHDLLAMKPELRSGDRFYLDVMKRIIRAGDHADVVDALKDRTLVLIANVSALCDPLASTILTLLLHPQIFPEIYIWTCYPVTALMEETWKSRVVDILQSSSVCNPPLGAGVVVTAGPPPQPDHQYLELIALLERLKNFCYCGAARVFPRQLTDLTWIGLAIKEAGFPMIWPGLHLIGAQQSTPEIDLRDWPCEPISKMPLVASKRSQELTYGEHHFQVSRHPYNTWLSVLSASILTALFDTDCAGIHDTVLCQDLCRVVAHHRPAGCWSRHA